MEDIEARDGYKRGMIVAVLGFTLAVGLAVWFLVLDANNQTLPTLTLVIAVLYLTEAWVFKRLAFPPAPRPVNEPVPGVTVSTNMDEKTPKAAEAWDKLPTVPVPWLGDVRRSVIAFAQQHGFQPYEAERGYALLDAQGHWYRAAVV